MTTIRQPEPILISTSVAAKQLGCSAQHVRNQIREGKIRGVQLGRKQMVPRSEIARLADERLANITHELSSQPSAVRGGKIRELRQRLREIEEILDELEV